MLADRVRMSMSIRPDINWGWQDIMPDIWNVGGGNTMFPKLVAQDDAVLYVVVVNQPLKTDLDNVVIRVNKNSQYVYTSNNRYGYNPDDYNNPSKTEVSDMPNSHLLCRYEFGTETGSTIEMNPLDLKKGDYFHLFFSTWITSIKEDNPVTFSFRLNSENGAEVLNLSLWGSTSCYLTTCMVDYYGKDDDGIELTSMRKLREKYKFKHAETLKEYSIVSKYIIRGIEESGNRDYWYSEIKKVVDKIVIWVSNEEWEKAEIAYLNLYLELKDLFYSEVI